jgi:CRISPR-associated endoribonuclease Cas6
MPYSLVLHCVSSNGPLRAADLQGQKGLALFLQDLMQQQDPAVARQLHAHQKAKPFTTVLLPFHASAQRNAGAAALHEVKMRLTLLDDALYPLISQFFLRNIGRLPAVRLGRASLTVARVLTTPQSGEPWADFARFEDILAVASESAASWAIRFVTPTAFRSGDADMPLPVPRLCFQSWLTSWDRHAPAPFFPDQATRKAFLSEVVEGNVSVSYSQLRLAHRTLYFDGKRAREPGFIGACRFTVRPARVASQHRRMLDVLTHYSYYAGTGRKTTMGMGLTRRLDQE